MFKKRSENGGMIDKNIRTTGRPKIDGKLTRREIKEKEQMALLRKLKPHISSAVATAAKILNNEKAAEASRLKACTILLENYKELVEEVFNGNDDDEGEEIQSNQSKTAFSLVMLPPTPKTEE